MDLQRRLFPKAFWTRLGVHEPSRQAAWPERYFKRLTVNVSGTGRRFGPRSSHFWIVVDFGRSLRTMEKNTTTELKLVGNVGRMPPVFFFGQGVWHHLFPGERSGQGFCIPKFSWRWMSLEGSWSEKVQFVLEIRHANKCVEKNMASNFQSSKCFEMSQHDWWDDETISKSCKRVVGIVFCKTPSSSFGTFGPGLFWRLFPQNKLHPAAFAQTSSWPWSPVSTELQARSAKMSLGCPRKKTLQERWEMWGAKSEITKKGWYFLSAVVLLDHEICLCWKKSFIDIYDNYRYIL